MIWPLQQQRPNNFQIQGRGYQGGPPSNNMQYMGQRILPQQQSQKLLSPDRIGGLTKKLDNVQQILKVVQSAAPIVQQYAPIVKNIPMMFQLMKALNEDNESNDSTEDEDTDELTDDDWEDHLESDESSVKENPRTKGQKSGTRLKKDGVGKSVPKLFI